MAPSLKAGVGRVNVTPAAGNWMAGYPPELGQVEEFPDNIKGFVGRKKPSTGVHDPLWAKALVLDNGDERIAIVSIDTLIVTKIFTDALRAEAQQRWNIAPPNLLINTTHTPQCPGRIWVAQSAQRAAGKPARCRYIGRAWGSVRRSGRSENRPGARAGRRCGHQPPRSECSYRSGSRRAAGRWAGWPTDSDPGKSDLPPGHHGLREFVVQRRPVRHDVYDR